jgi:tetratricopeptide (TPR) repeat protein
MKNRILFILFIMIHPIYLFSQNQPNNNYSDYEIEKTDIGSLLKTLENSTTTLQKFDATLPIVWAYFISNEAEKVTFHLDELLRYAELLEEPNYKAEVYLLAGEVADFNNPSRDSFFIEGLKYATLNRTKVDLYMERFGLTLYENDLERGKDYLEEMRKYIEDTTSLLMIDYYFHSSNYFYAKKNILKSLEYLKKAKKICQNNGLNITKVNQNISNIYSDLHADEKSLATNLEQREEARLAKNPYNELASNFEIMNDYLNLKDYEAVKATGYEAINLSKRTDADTGLGYMYYLFGLAFMEEGQLDSAEYYFFSNYSGTFFAKS